MIAHNSNLSGNSATHRGGSINHDVATLTLQNTTLSGTASEDGGDIFNDGTLTATKSTLSGNSAGDRGGGIFNNLGTVSLTRTTLVNNTPDNCFNC